MGMIVVPLGSSPRTLVKVDSWLVTQRGPRREAGKLKALDEEIHPPSVQRWLNPQRSHDAFHGDRRRHEPGTQHLDRTSGFLRELSAGLAEPALALLVVFHRRDELIASEVRPQHVGHVQLGVGQLPQQEVR